MAMKWRRLDGYKGVQVAHAARCPGAADANGRCRGDERGCTPRYRKRIGRGWSRATPELSEALGAARDSAKAAPARADVGRTFEDVAIEW